MPAQRWGSVGGRSRYGRRDLPPWFVDLAFAVVGTLVVLVVLGLAMMMVSQRIGAGR